MKNLKKIKREHLKSIHGGIGIKNPAVVRCVYDCDPPPGFVKCPDLCCFPPFP